MYCKILPLGCFCAKITHESYGKQLYIYFKGIVPLHLLWGLGKMHHPVCTNEIDISKAVELFCLDQWKLQHLLC